MFSGWNVREPITGGIFLVGGLLGLGLAVAVAREAQVSERWVPLGAGLIGGAAYVVYAWWLTQLFGRLIYWVPSPHIANGLYLAYITLGLAGFLAPGAVLVPAVRNIVPTQVSTFLGDAALPTYGAVFVAFGLYYLWLAPARANKLRG